MFKNTRTNQVALTEPSTETTCGLPGRSGAGVQDRLPRGVHPLDDQVVQHHLLLGPLDDVLLHGAFGHQTVDVDLQGEAVRWAHGNLSKSQSHTIISSDIIVLVMFSKRSATLFMKLL